MEELELGVEEALFGQYLQDEDTATELPFIIRLYEKWKKELKPEQILTGAADVPTNLPSLPFDERLCIVWLLLQRIYTMGGAYEEQQKLSDSLRFFADGLGQGTAGAADSACGRAPGPSEKESGGPQRKRSVGCRGRRTGTAAFQRDPGLYGGSQDRRSYGRIFGEKRTGTKPGRAAAERADRSHEKWRGLRP